MTHLAPLELKKMLTSSTLFINVKNVQISHSPAATCIITS